MPVGQIVKAISGFYYVQTEDKKVYQCRARGVFKFKKKQQSILVGDWVEFTMTGLDEGVITFVQPRQTELIRPPIANVTQAVVVCSLKEPDFSQMPLDRFLVHAEHEGLKIVICFTKQDLITDPNMTQDIVDIYRKTGYPLIISSIYTKEGITQLEEHLHEHTTVFAGQSGVGKSSLLNLLLPEHDLETGLVSKRIGRGRHTTRQVELIALPSGGQVADTPGFSQLTFKGIESTQLGNAFPEFALHSHECRFRGCLHLNEPGCQVQEAVATTDIHPSRYHHYKIFIEEIKSQRSY